MPENRKAETNDVSMAKEVTSIKTHLLAEMNSSETHQVRGDSDARPKKSSEDLKENEKHSNGARNAKREEENRRRISRNHVCPNLKLITRSRETEKYRDKDNESNANIEGTPLMYEAKLPHRGTAQGQGFQKARLCCRT